jgi:hypothetical protein
LELKAANVMTGSNKKGAVIAPGKIAEFVLGLAAYD